MAKRNKDLGVISGMIFALCACLICSVLFVGEARVFGQLVAVVIGGGVGSMDWWQARSIATQMGFIVLTVSVTVFSVMFRQQLTTVLGKAFVMKVEK